MEHSRQFPHRTFKHHLFVGGGTLIVQDSDLSQPNSSNLGTWTIKIVAASSSQRKAHPNLDWNNYNAVKKQFDISD
ncbi:MAG TPA: hypothetical protein VFU15_04915 [Bacteroidia bacterium]|nr:hypothetical protein [Bacteroidia bacterium]